jgi:hypothetical protein
MIAAINAVKVVLSIDISAVGVFEDTVPPTLDEFALTAEDYYGMYASA